MVSFRKTFGLVLPCLASLISAEIEPSAYCTQACVSSLSAFSFDKESYTDYYKTLCVEKLRLESFRLCGQLYCTPEDNVAGFEYLDGICQDSLGQTIPPYEPNPNYSRAELLKMARESKKIAATGKPVSEPVVPDKATFDITYRTSATFANEIHAALRYGTAMYIFWGCVIAISLFTKVLSVIRLKLSKIATGDEEQRQSVQEPSGFMEKLRIKTNYLILTPGFVGKRSVEPYGWCTVPPFVQSVTVSIFIIVNIILCSVNYHTFVGNLYYPKLSTQIWRYVSDRCGIVAIANLPILWLFGTRNNVLLWLTGWSPATFNSFHRWVARIATLEAVMHSIGYTAFEYSYDPTGVGYIDSWADQYWRLGAVATVMMSFLLIFSVYGLRTKAYDFFLVLHIVLAVIVLVAMFYHVKIFDGEYNGYLWACTAIWALDRFLRLVRVISLNANRFSKSQLATAEYLEDSALIRVEVPIPKAAALTKGSSYYLYAMHGWSFFQSHPFTASFAFTPENGSVSNISDDSSQEGVPNKETVVVDETSSTSSEGERGDLNTSRLRFYIRPFKGWTARLRDMSIQGKHKGKVNYRIFVEGPYGVKESIHRYDNVMFMMGGSGVTVALQYLQTLLLKKQSDPLFKPPRLHFVWAVRQPNMLADFRSEMKVYERQLGARFSIHVTGDRTHSIVSVSNEKSHAEPDMEITGWKAWRGRPDCYKVILDERRDTVGSLAVVSCAPANMSDDCRDACVQAMRATRKDVKYIQENFSW